MMSMRSFAPKGTKLRPIQEKACAWLEENWNKADVFILDMPVGSGKSLQAYMLMRWVGQKLKKTALTIVPENALLDQYVQTFPRLPSLYRKSHYECNRYHERTTACELVKESTGRYCKQCPFVLSLKRIRTIPYGVTNYHLAMAHKLHRDVLIVDEAHGLVPYVKELAATKLWRHLHRYPEDIRTYNELKHWLMELPNIEQRRELMALKATFGGERPKFLVKKTYGSYRGEQRPCLELLPIDVSEDPAGAWLRNQPKLVLMSATLGDADMRDLGLDKKRVMRFSAESPIPPDCRPVTYVPAFSLASDVVASATFKVVRTVQALLDHHAGEGGLLHVPYSLARRLQETELGKDERLLWHRKSNKRGQIAELKKGEGKVLVASGLYEGLDLKGDDFTWQAIVKVPWPNLGDPSIRWMADHDQDWYAWQASRLILQACGRICRGADDFGRTYILDSSFGRLYRDNQKHFPQWWRDALEVQE